MVNHPGKRSTAPEPKTAGKTRGAHNAAQRLNKDKKLLNCGRPGEGRPLFCVYGGKFFGFFIKNLKMGKNA